jgi:hypothetical protein
LTAEEKRDRHVQSLGNVRQAARTNAIDPSFVLMYLLERDAEFIRKLCQRHPARHTPGADASPDILITRVGRCGFGLTVHINSTG